MATKGVELASAYISLGISTEGVPRAVEKALGSGARTAKRTGAQAGQAYSGSFRSALNSGLSGGVATRWFSELRTEARNSGNVAGYAAGRAMGAAMTAGLAATTAGLTAAVGGIGYTLFKGFDRYKSLDATAKRLQNMGKSGEQVKNIVNDITEVVKGTPIALDEAAGAATKFLQGGVKEGQELNTVLTAIADASGASGENFSDLATIFGQVMNKGKLQAEEMLQFNERNINIQAMLRDEFGWTGDELTKLSEDGAISFQHLIQAVEGNVGGMAKRMGDTIDGALGNLQTSVARVGANFISAIFGDPLDTTEGPGGMAQAINNVTEKIDGLNTWVVSHQGDIKQFFTDATETVGDLYDRLTDVGSWLVSNKDTIALIGTAFAGWKVAGLIGDLTRVGTLLGTRGAGGRGGSGILGQLGLALLLGNQLNNLGSGDRGPNDGPDVTGSLVNIGAGAAIGWQFGGPAGAGAGALGGSLINPVTDLLNPPGPAQNGVLPTAPGTRNGQDPTVGGIPIPGLQQPSNPYNRTGGPNSGAGSSLPGQARSESLFGDAASGFYRSGPAAKKGESARDFAHRAMMPYWQGQGLTVGDHAADQYGEHQNGALDIMVPSIERGNAVLQEVLKDPNVYGVIWNNQAYGYGRGFTPRPYTGPNPHTDHLHVWYKPKGFESGGAALGPGGPTSDKIPAWLSNGEHVLTAADVAAMGGQGGVYAFRNALHRKNGGEIWKTGAITWPPLPPQPKDKSRPGGVPDLGKGNVPGPHLPDWGPGTTFGPPAGDWWFKPVNPDDILFPEWLGPGYPWKHPYDKDRMKPLGFNTGGAVEDILFGRHGEGRSAPPIEQGRWTHFFPRSVRFNRGEQPRTGQFNPGMRIDTSRASLSHDYNADPYKTRTRMSWNWFDIKDSARVTPAELDNPMLRHNQNMLSRDPLWQFFSSDVERQITGAYWPKAHGFADGGAVEDEMLKQFIQAGAGKVGAATAARMNPQTVPVGPDGQPINGAQLPEGLGRTEGFIPAGAGFSGKTGGGILGGFIAMGGEAAKGAIQVAADLGKMAASAAASAGSFGAGAAAGPAAGAGIQIGADMAKRGVDYGVEMANIGIGAFTEIASPFGAPRWLSDVDPTAFMPNLGGSPLATTAAEALKQGMGPGMAEPHGQNAGQPPGPVAHQPGPPPGPVPPGPGIGGAAGQPVQAPPPEPQQQGNGFNFIDIIKGGIFDNGGVLQPNSVGVNLSNRPEYVFTDSQWKTMEAHASRGGGMNVTYNVMGKDLDDTLRELKKHERRQSGPLMRGKAGLG